MDFLKHTIDNGYTDLLSTINSGVNLLFWEMGTLINNNSGSGSFMRNDLLNELSSGLSSVFGDFFNLENLSLIKLFAEKCPVSTIGQISDAINWEYIIHFLELEGEKEWLFYMQLIQTDALDPMGLKKAILQKAVKHKTIDAEKVLSRSDLKSLYRTSSQLYFNKNELFRKLLEPHSLNDEVIKRFSLQHSTNELVMNIYRLILEFQSETHYVLNMQFNMLMWAIGGSIIRLSTRLNVSVAKCINQCIQEFGVYFPSLFNKEELSYCIILAEQYKAPNDFREIAEIVSWPYIKILLEVNSLKNRYFIAQQVFKSGIDLRDLKNMIIDNSFDFTNISGTSDMATNHNSTTTEIINGNNISSITEVQIEPIVHPLHDLNRNIYKNPELLSFLTNNTY